MDGYCVSMLLTVLACMYQVNGQCMRFMMYLDATEDYQEFETPGYPLSYYTMRECSWRLIAANSSYAIRLDVLDCSVESGPNCEYDYAQVFDGLSISYPSLGKFCGTSRPTFISSNDTMMFYFYSDASVTSRGIKARYKSGPRESLFDDLEDESSNLAVILGVTIGCSVFLVVIVAGGVIAYKQFKGKTSVTPGPHRPGSSILVRPNDDNVGPSYYATHFPPAYEDIENGPSAGCSNGGFNADHKPGAFPRPIESGDGLPSNGDEKAMWRKEPLEDMQDSYEVSNTRFQQSNGISTDPDEFSLPGATGMPAVETKTMKMSDLSDEAEGAGPSHTLKGKLQSGNIQPGLLQSANTPIPEKK